MWWFGGQFTNMPRWFMVRKWKKYLQQSYCTIAIASFSCFVYLKIWVPQFIEADQTLKWAILTWKNKLYIAWWYIILHSFDHIILYANPCLVAMPPPAAKTRPSMSSKSDARGLPGGACNIGELGPWRASSLLSLLSWSADIDAHDETSELAVKWGFLEACWLVWGKRRRILDVQG